MIQRARTAKHKHTREEHLNLNEVDPVATLKRNNKITREHRNLLKLIQTGRIWTAKNNSTI